MKFFAQIKNGRLIPEYNSDYESMAKLRPGVSYYVEIKQPRNIDFHRRFFALMNLAFQNQETFNNIDSMRKWLLMRAGFYTEIITPTGVMYEAESISFSSTDELRFNEIYSGVLDVICKWLGTDKESIAMELVDFM